MPRRLIRSIKASADRKRRERGIAAPSHFEQLEPRILFSASSPAFIQDIVADNRGLITMEVCGELMQSTVNTDSVQVFTAGADNLFGTFDDVTVAASVGYNPSTDQITIFTLVEPDERYAVRLDSSIIRDVDGFFLDGEFNGGGMPTGNGLSGGDLLFYTKAASTKIARISTNLGDIDIELFTAETPISVANFLNYANSGRYDNVIIHRSVMDFVIQGGGYENELGFDSIDRDSPIQNEPGISNLRGTIAYAKNPNSPNSATSEWFLNLGDNSENLDNQNGGFTVFGMITDDAGLEVMDAIAALPTINASGVNSSLSDMPVTDIDSLNGNPAAVTPAVSVSIDRVSVIQELSATPPEQIQAESFTFASNRDAFVRVYDLGGIGRDEIDDVVKVKFTDNRVASITIVGDIPAGALGIVIGDANRVGTIKDASADSSVAFIYSNAPVSNLKLKGEITGYNINGLNLGGTLLSDDIDGDGVYTDQTALLINSGYTNSITSSGAIVGDILAPGGVAKLSLKGPVSDSEIRIGLAPDPLSTLKVDIADAQRTTFETAIPIQSMKVGSWTVDTDTPNATLRAPSIANLRIDGAFDVDVTLTGAPLPDTDELGKLIAKDGLFGATFDVNGNIGSVSVNGDTDSVDLNAAGSIGVVKLGDVMNSSITSTTGEAIRSIKVGVATDTVLDVNQHVNNLSAGGWTGGSIDALSIKTLKFTDRDSEVNTDITLTTVAENGLVANNVNVYAEVTGGEWVLQGDVKTIKMQDGSDAVFTVSGDLRTFNAGVLNRFDLGVQDEARSVNSLDWIRGNLSIDILNKLTVNGDFRSDLLSTSTNKITITGDLFISDLFFIQQPDFFGTYSLRSLTVGGEMRDVEFRAAFRVGDITAKGMHNSIIGVSNNIPSDDFPLSTDVDGFSSIDSVTITGPRNGAPNFTDSYIVAASIGDVVLGEVEPFNSGHEYGVGAFQLGSISYFAEGEQVTMRNNGLNVSPAPFGDFEIRIGFERFDDVGA